MKRIALIAILLIFFALPVFSQTTDYTSLTTGQDPSQAICIQTNSAISALSSKMDSVQRSADNCFKTSDIESLKTELYEGFDLKVNDMIAKNLIVLLVFTVFFFVLMFLLKAKRWF